MKMFGRIVLPLFIFLTSLFVFWGFAGVSDVNAAGTFTLTNGQVVTPAGDGEEYRIIAQDLFTQMAISVAENGEVNGEALVPFNFELNGDSISGQVSFKLQGTYDSDKHTLKGSFTYKHDRIKKHTFNSGNVAELKGSRNIKDGKFTGTADGNNVKIEFVNIGNVSFAGIPAETEKESGAKPPDYDVPDIEYQPGVDTGARFASIQGEVEMYPDGNPDDRSFAKMDVKIEPGMHIFTGEDSNVIITFADMSTYKLPPNSEIVIKSLKSKSQISLIAGKIWSNFKKIGSGETIEVETSQAVLGIKGTTLVLATDSNQSTLKVIEGTVSFKSKSGGKSEMVNAGETISAGKNGLSDKTNFNIAEENASWNNLPGSAKAAAGRNKYIYYAIGAVGILVLAVFVIFMIKRKK